MFAWVLDTPLIDVDESSSSKNLPVSAYLLNFRESFFLEIPENFEILWKATVKTSLSLSGFFNY